MQIESCRICDAHLEVLLLRMLTSAGHSLELAGKMPEDLLDYDRRSMAQTPDCKKLKNSSSLTKRELFHIVFLLATKNT